jgi:hypothetical protein
MVVFEWCQQNAPLADLEDDAQLAPVVIVSIHPQKLAGLEGSHGR